MAITRWNPWDLARPWYADEDWFRKSSDESGIDVYETDNDVVVEAAIPGLTEKEVDVTYEDGILRIRGHKEVRDEEKNKKKVVYRETSYTSFDYMTTLPRSVDADKITAEVEDGLVKVKAPIAQESKPRKIQAVKRIRAK